MGLSLIIGEILSAFKPKRLSCSKLSIFRYASGKLFDAALPRSAFLRAAKHFKKSRARKTDAGQTVFNSVGNISLSNLFKFRLMRRIPLRKSSVAVSYTHLDVYKRQVFHRDDVPFSCLVDGVDEAGQRCGFAAARRARHQDKSDVYKRQGRNAAAGG